MRKRHLYIATFIVVLCTVILFVIYRPKQQFGHFTRVIKHIKLNSPTLFTDYGFINSVVCYRKVYYVNRLTDILRLDSNGKIIDTLFCRVNNTPYQLFIGFDVDSSGIYVQDARGKALSILDSTGFTFRQVRVTEPLVRSVHLKDDIYLYKTESKSDNFLNEILKIKDFRANKSHVFSNILPTTNDNGIGTDGFFVKSPSGNIFHVYYYMSGILIFDSAANYKGTFNSTDGSNIPPEAIKTPMGHVPSPHSPIVHFAGAADKTYLYIASNFTANNEHTDVAAKNIIIDVYDQMKRKYLYSFYIPKNGKGNISDLTFYDKKICVIQASKTLSIYNIDK